MTASNHRDWRAEDLSQPQGGAVDPTKRDAHGTDDFRRDYTSHHILRDHLEKEGANSSELWTCSRLIHEEEPADFLFFTETFTHWCESPMCASSLTRILFSCRLLFLTPGPEMVAWNSTRLWEPQSGRIVTKSRDSSQHDRNRLTQGHVRILIIPWQFGSVWIGSVFQQLSDWTWIQYWKTPPGLRYFNHCFADATRPHCSAFTLRLTMPVKLFFSCVNFSMTPLASLFWD